METPKSDFAAVFGDSGISNRIVSLRNAIFPPMFLVFWLTISPTSEVEKTVRLES